MSQDTNLKDSRIADEIRHLRIQFNLVASVAFMAGYFVLTPINGAPGIAAKLVSLAAVIAWAFATVAIISRDLPGLRAWVSDWRSSR